MAEATSAGLLVWRRGEDGPAFLLAHPGGPFWRNKDEGAWTIAKGLIEPGEVPLDAGRREFREETGLNVEGPFQPLTPIRQKAGKQVLCWLVEADLDLAAFAPGVFEMEWPPRSGRTASFPEVDRIAYFAAGEARAKLLESQRPLLEEALSRIG